MTAKPAMARSPAFAHQHATDLETIRDDLARLADRVGRIAGALATATPDHQQPAPSPMAEATAFFRRLKLLQQLQTSQLGSFARSEASWQILLELMLARLANASLSVQEIGLRCPDLAPARIEAELSALEEQQQVESFLDPASPGQPLYSLSGETARRLIELYRAQRHGI